MTPGIASAIATTFAAAIAGWFALLARKAQAQSPETVAGGYSKLVADMREQQESLAARVEQLEEERRAQREEIRSLSVQVNWLINHIPPDKRDEFDQMFPRLEP